MALVNITLPVGESPVTGKQITFKSPCHSSDVTGVLLNGVNYSLVDAKGKSISLESFSEGALVSIILDVEGKKAFIQNPASTKIVDEHRNKLVSARAHGIHYNKKGELLCQDIYGKWHIVVETPPTIYGVKIDETEEDRDARISYTDANEHFIKAVNHLEVSVTSGDPKWDETEIFKDIRPCVFKGGKVQCYLDKNNFTEQVQYKGICFEDSFPALYKSHYISKLEAENLSIYDPGNDNVSESGLEKYTCLGEGYDRWDENEYNPLSTTICYRGDYSLRGSFELPSLDTEYYLIIKFSSPVRPNGVENKIGLTATFGNLNSEQITFPQKGKPWEQGDPWEQNESEYKFQYMIYKFSPTQLYNYFLIEKPKDLGDTCDTIEIDYVAVCSVDTPDISNEAEYHTISPTNMSIEGRSELMTSKCEGILKTDAETGDFFYQMSMKEDTNVGSNEGIMIRVEPFDSINEEFLSFEYSIFTKLHSPTGIYLRVGMYYKDGTPCTIYVMYGIPSEYSGEKVRSSFDLQDHSIFDLESDGSGKTLSDVDHTRPIRYVEIIPFVAGETYSKGDSFNLYSILFSDRGYHNLGSDFKPSSISGEVMIEVPKMGYKISKQGSEVHISVTRNDNVSGYCYDAFKKGDHYNDYIYIGAYAGVGDNYKSLYNGSRRLYSENPFSGESYSPRSIITKNGYSILSYYPLNLIRCLFLLRYGRTVQSPGFTGSEESELEKKATGYYCNKGMNYWAINTGNKFIGIEGLANYNAGYGHLAPIEGLTITTDSHIEIATENFSDPASYAKYITTLNLNGDTKCGYPLQIEGGNNVAFFPKDFDGSFTVGYGFSFCAHYRSFICIYKSIFSSDTTPAQKTPLFRIFKMYSAE